MTTTDPIADMLTRIRNALQARHPKVDVPASRLKTDIAKILKDEGYIANFKLTEDGTKKTHPHLSEVHARQRAGDFADRARVAPGLPRVCAASKNVPRVLGGLGINILTTPRGVMTGLRRARKASAAKFCVTFGRSNTYMSTSWKKADSAAEGREDHRRRTESAGGRAQGQADGADSGTGSPSASRTAIWSCSATATIKPRCTG